MEALHEPREQIDECLAVFRIGEFFLKAVRNASPEIALGHPSRSDQLQQIGCIFLREHTCRENLRVQFRAELLVGFFRLEWRALSILCEGFENCLALFVKSTTTTSLLPWWHRFRRETVCTALRSTTGLSRNMPASNG